MSLERPRWLPARAALVVVDEIGISIRGEARLGERRLAQLTWNRDGRLLWEKPFDAAGAAHGVEVERDDAGHVVWCAQWVRGRMHGPLVRFDADGRPVVVTRFVRGRGTDIWTSCGEVSEVREMADGVPHGLVRWGNPRRPFEEGHYSRGKRHGIFREWSPGGELVEGFPHYYVNDVRVTPLAYAASRAEDDSLPPYRARDDSNKRALPRGVREALERAKRAGEKPPRSACLRFMLDLAAAP